MSPPATMHTGPLGSTIHALRADAGTVAELAAVDWNRHYRRVWLDPAGVRVREEEAPYPAHAD